MGGAVEYTGSSLSITGSTFSDNTASGTGGAEGGGVQVENIVNGLGVSGSVTITNSTFSGNSASGGNDGISNGGGLFFSGSAGFNGSVTGSTFTGNTASSTASTGAATGGGIDAEGGGTDTFSVSNSRIVGNSVSASSAVASGYYGLEPGRHHYQRLVGLQRRSRGQRLRYSLLRPVRRRHEHFYPLAGAERQRQPHADQCQRHLNADRRPYAQFQRHRRIQRSQRHTRHVRRHARQQREPQQHHAHQRPGDLNLHRRVNLRHRLGHSDRSTIRKSARRLIFSSPSRSRLARPICRSPWMARPIQRRRALIGWWGHRIRSTLLRRRQAPGGSQYVWNSWSEGGAQSQSLDAPKFDHNLHRQLHYAISADHAGFAVG